jgi:glycosyltransferase involved in cell wall biosynthesis
MLTDTKSTDSSSRIDLGVSSRNTAKATQLDVARTRTLLFVTNSFSYGGSEKHLLELIRRINQPGTRVIILCTDSDPFTERLSSQSPAEVVVQQERNLESIADWKQAFKRNKPDAVILVYGTLWMLPWIAALAARLAGVPRIYAIHHLMPMPPPEPLIRTIKSPRDLLRRVIGKRVRRLLFVRIPPRLCDSTICVSNAVRDSLVADYGFPARRMRTIHNGVSCEDFEPGPDDRTSTRAALGIAPNEFLLVCTARLSREKGIDILISAMARIVQNHPACKCAVIGDGPLRDQLNQEVKARGLDHHVLLLGFREDVRPYLAAADAFALVSHIEGLPYSVLEAMASGLPCVVTNVGGNREAVIDRSTGFVINPGSVDEAVEAVEYLLSHPQERAKMAQAARHRAFSEFEIEAKMAEFRKVLLA